MTVPTKVELAPIVAEEPTTKKTLHGCTPPTSTMLEAVAVTSVEPAWNTNTEEDVPRRVSVPVRARLVADE